MVWIGPSDSARASQHWPVDLGGTERNAAAGVAERAAGASVGVASCSSDADAGWREAKRAVLSSSSAALGAWPAAASAPALDPQQACGRSVREPRSYSGLHQQRATLVQPSPIRLPATPPPALAPPAPLPPPEPGSLADRGVPSSGAESDNQSRSNEPSDVKVRALQAQLLTAVRSNRILRSRVERLEEREMPGTRREADVGSEHSACRPSSAGDSHAGTASSTEALPSYAESDPPSPRLLFTDGDAAHPAVPTRVSLQRRALNSNHAATAAAATVAIAKAAAAQPLSNYCARACRSAASVRSSDGDGDGTMSSKAVASEASWSNEIERAERL